MSKKKGVTKTEGLKTRNQLTQKSGGKKYYGQIAYVGMSIGGNGGCFGLGQGLVPAGVKHKLKEGPGKIYKEKDVHGRQMPQSRVIGINPIRRGKAKKTGSKSFYQKKSRSYQKEKTAVSGGFRDRRKDRRRS